MGDYHTVYKDVEGVTTEWDDLMVKYNIKEGKEKPAKAAPWAPAPDIDKSNADWLDRKDEAELEGLEDDLGDDRFMEEYRRKRLTELRASASRPRFGSVELIKASEFVREVSQAPPDVWVVVHLFQDYIRECGVLSQCLKELSEKYPGTKFVKMVSTDCIAKYPDANLPTLIVYNQSNVKATLVGMKRFGGQQCTPEDVAFTLCQVGPVLDSSEGGGGGDVRARVARDYVEKLVDRHERERGDDSD